MKTRGLKSCYLPLILLVLGTLLVSCKAVDQQACPITEPAWVKPPEDSAVSGTPEFGHYYANEGRAILASAWWTDQPAYQPRAGEEGIKMGWFRPAGETLEISGARIDAEAPPLVAEVPCCYPTRFQATGLIFPTEGCWQISARAGVETLEFVLWVEAEGE